MAPKTVNRKRVLTADLPARAARSSDGSVIIGVLVAMTFVGIVTAFMIKNTGAQAKTAHSYSAVTDADLATQNGLVATEHYFASSGNADSVLIKLSAMLSGGAPEDVFGDHAKGKNRRIGTSDQYFSSKIVDAREVGGVFFSQFEIGGGRRERGPGIKGVRAFYEVGNIEYGSSGRFTGSNAIYLGGPLQDGNNGMEVFGDATFEGGVKLQNKPALFHGTTWIGGTLDIPNTNEIKFFDNTYVGGESKFHFTGSSIPTVFMKDVGFEGNINMGGGGLTTAGNVWMNGNKIESMNRNFTSIPHNGDPKSLYAANGMGAWNAATQTWNTSAWGTGSVNGYARPAPNGAHYDIPGKLNMNLESRREPDLDISVIPEDRYMPAYLATASGNQHGQPNGGDLSVARLHYLYDSLKQENKLFNDHVVLRVTRNDRPPYTNINFPNSYAAPFEKKVIFVLEDGVTLNVSGRFYNSAGNASTMVYVKPGAKVDEFGCSGLFRGLIYVDPANTLRQGFKWGDGSAIDGAALLKGSGPLTWNSGGNTGGNPTKITRDESVLDGFAPFVPGNGTGSGTTVVKKDAGEPIEIWPIGVYFY